MFKIILVIIGCLIGAGFASGREIYLFFTRYGEYGIFGLTLTGVIISFIIYNVLKMTKASQIKNYHQLINIINYKYKKINKFLNFIVNAFLLISFYIMIAGFSSYFNQMYNVPTFATSIFFVFICYIIFKRNINGVIQSNKLLVPILIVLIVYLGIKNLPFICSNFSIKDNMQIGKNIFNNNWLLSSFLYVSYNSIILIPVLTNLGGLIEDKKQILKISILSGTFIIILGLVIYGLLLRNTYFISQLEMPLIEVVNDFGSIFRYVYGFIIITSIFTSAISTGYSLLENVSKDRKKYNLILFIICISGVFISNIGFSRLVGMLYPLFGAFGLIQLYIIIKRVNIY